MNIILTGSVAFDYLMTFPGYFRDHFLPDKLDSISLSFLVDSYRKRRGGIAPNIAYTLALLGERPHIMATVGEDFEEYRKWLESNGVDTTLMKVIPGEVTASFFCNTDRANNQIASFYPGAMSYGAQLSFRSWQGPLPDLVVISPNDPEAMKQHVAECRELGIPYLYDPSQQIVRLTGGELRMGIEGALALFVNDYEFGLVLKMTGMSASDLMKHLQFMVVTAGSKGSTVYSRDDQYFIPVVPPEKIVDPTGVGDAYRGGFLTGFSHGLDPQICGQMGTLAATYCLECEGTQGHCYTLTEFVTRFRKHFTDHGQLDKLLKS
ncbi:MAG: carbohydrate kinase family protein [Anaerolineales bacterium]|nr:carbohydrate kinase family protein [Anaerolineae bacterium]PWB56656.1 MAG: carbohydrate kinase family protein [Anaerolineales bacterium]